MGDTGYTAREQAEAVSTVRFFKRAGLVMLAVAASIGVWSAVRGNPSDLERFQDLADKGGSCRSLYEFRNSLDNDSPDLPAINAELRAIGCPSAGATRP